MPEQGVIGHGMPNYAQKPDHVEVNLGSAGFAAVNFTGLGEGKFSLYKALKQAEWERLLPDIQTFTKIIIDQNCSTTYKWNKRINTINRFASLLFLIAVLGLGLRFFWHVIDPDLRDEAHWTEHTRVFTDILGYFLAPFIITLSTAHINQKILDNAKKRSAENCRDIIKDYIKLRKSFIASHNRTTAFFGLCELIYKFKKLNPLDRNYEASFDDLEQEAIDIYKFIDRDFGEKTQQKSPSVIIKKLKTFLLSSDFSSVMANIKKNIKLDAISRVGLSEIPHNDFPTVRAYCDAIDKDRTIQELVIDIIGTISIEKTNPDGSILLSLVRLMHESTLSGIREALNQYWNNPNITKAFIHPYDVDISELAKIINLIMLDKFKDFNIKYPIIDKPCIRASKLLSNESVAFFSLCELIHQFKNIPNNNDYQNTFNILEQKLIRVYDFINHPFDVYQHYHNEPRPPRTSEYVISKIRQFLLGDYFKNLMTDTTLKLADDAIKSMGNYDLKPDDINLVNNYANQVKINHCLQHVVIDIIGEDLKGKQYPYSKRLGIFSGVMTAANQIGIEDAIELYKVRNDIQQAALFLYNKDKSDLVKIINNRLSATYPKFNLQHPIFDAPVINNIPLDAVQGVVAPVIPIFNNLRMPAVLQVNSLGTTRFAVPN